MTLILVMCRAEAAEVVNLVAQAQLGETIGRAGYCCVVDARSEDARARAPIAEAVSWREGLVIRPTAAVVVVGESDESARAVGERIAANSGAREVIVVQGGFASWQGFLQELAAGPPENMAFIVPHNTCEAGVAVLELRRE